MQNNYLVLSNLFCNKTSLNKIFFYLLLSRTNNVGFCWFWILYNMYRSICKNGILLLTGVCSPWCTNAIIARLLPGSLVLKWAWLYYQKNSYSPNYPKHDLRNGGIQIILSPNVLWKYSCRTSNSLDKAISSLLSKMFISILVSLYKFIH